MPAPTLTMETARVLAAQFGYERQTIASWGDSLPHCVEHCFTAFISVRWQRDQAELALATLRRAVRNVNEAHAQLQEFAR